ncbi:Uncharacterised protein [Candidatus Gugararchaeum adminiculabundum]|nr:Uncharacterised protein [Candidatus Gugararchaeum adminiculabundum]
MAGFLDQFKPYKNDGVAGGMLGAVFLAATPLCCIAPLIGGFLSTIIMRRSGDRSVTNDSGTRTGAVAGMVTAFAALPIMLVWSVFGFSALGEQLAVANSNLGFLGGNVSGLYGIVGIVVYLIGAVILFPILGAIGGGIGAALANRK